MIAKVYYGNTHELLSQPYEGKMPTADQIRDDYVLVAEFSGRPEKDIQECLEFIYKLLQDNATFFNKAKPTVHTSMSCGDAIQLYSDNGKNRGTWICMPDSWKLSLYSF